MIRLIVASWRIKKLKKMILFLQFSLHSPVYNPFGTVQISRYDCDNETACRFAFSEKVESCSAHNKAETEYYEGKALVDDRAGAVYSLKLV